MLVDAARQVHLITSKQHKLGTGISSNKIIGKTTGSFSIYSHTVDLYLQTEKDHMTHSHFSQYAIFTLFSYGGNYYTSKSVTTNC